MEYIFRLLNNYSMLTDYENNCRPL